MINKNLSWVEKSSSTVSSSQLSSQTLTSLWSSSLASHSENTKFKQLKIAKLKINVSINRYSNEEDGKVGNVNKWTIKIIILLLKHNFSNLKDPSYLVEFTQMTLVITPCGFNFILAIRANEITRPTSFNNK